MRRRDFIAGLCLAATLGRAEAQQTGKVYRIAIASPATPVAKMTDNTSGDPAWRAFLGELRRLGYVEGANLRVERYSGGGRAEQFSELATDMLRLAPDIIFTTSRKLVLDLRGATTTIPIVVMMPDPLALGVVASLARPGGNVTGVSVDAGMEIWGKRFDLLSEAVPKMSKVGVLITRDFSASSGAEAVREAAKRGGIAVVATPLDDATEAGYRRAFAAMTRERADAVFVADEPEHYTNRRLIVELAEEARLPASFAVREAVEIGGFMAYAFDLPDAMQRAADDVGQILEGRKPGEIPVHQATKFELVINLKTARALGVTVPPSLLAQADEVIE